MTGDKLTITLTEDQQKQIRDATGKTITELSMEFTPTGPLAEKDLEQAAGGILIHL
jgi:hypothetical protein